MSDIRFDNAVIWTGLSPEPVRGWLHLRDGRIAGFGTTAPPLAAEVRDLGGQNVLPGFVDAHTHLSVSAWMPRTIDAARWRNATDACRSIEEAARTKSEHTWLLAMDADFDQFQGRLPHPDDLDRASGGRPALIADFSLHRSLLSSTALEDLARAGVPASADIDRRRCRATGLVWESAHAAAFRLALTNLALEVGAVGRAQLLDLDAERHLACGITACHDPCVPPSLVPELEDLRRRTPLRLSWSMVAEAGMLDPANASELCGCCGDGPASAKLFMDGAHKCALCLDPSHVLSMVARAARAAIRGDMRPIANLTAYKSVYRKGKFHMPYLRLEKQQLRQRLDLLATHGVRPKVHAVGNGAAVTIADALVETGATAAALEHLTFLSASDIDRIARAPVVASMQPGFLDHFGADILDRGITPRLKAYPVASLKRAGLPVALSSDNPCGPLSPLGNIRKAVQRQIADGRVVDAAEALSLPDAIAAYTVIGHQAIHGHPGHGIAPGATADLAILSGAPLDVATRVSETWINGSQVWRAT